MRETRPMSGLLRVAGKGVGILALVLLQNGCTSRNDWLWILNPNGPIAEWSVYYLVVDVLLLLVIIVPATMITLWALYRYSSRGKGTFDPSFNHSIVIEVFAWGVPLLLVAVMSYFSYQGAYAVAPYDPSVLADHPSADQTQPLEIDVISTDWQWLFVYPSQNVALANKLVIPTGRQIHMRLTSSSVTNDFYILKLVSQIYVMPGMRTKKKFLVDRPGRYRGFSTEFSGPGFSWMNYGVDVLTPAAFKQWVSRAKSKGEPLTYDRFKVFNQPTVNNGNKTITFAGVDPDLFNTVVKAVKSGKLQHTRPMELTEDMYSEKFLKHSNATKRSE